VWQFSVRRANNVLNKICSRIAEVSIVIASGGFLALVIVQFC
jgi:hypothetical protein